MPAPNASIIRKRPSSVTIANPKIVYAALWWLAHMSEFQAPERFLISDLTAAEETSR